MADQPNPDAETTKALSDELKNVLTYLDVSLDELANAATKLTAGLNTLGDVAARIRRQIEDPPAERHTLDIHGAGHGSTSVFPDDEPEPS